MNKGNTTQSQVKYTYWGSKRLRVPDGYKRVRWEDARDGDMVYINGTNAGEPKAYGPHQVVSNSACVLCNAMGQHFSEKSTSHVLTKLSDEG